MKKIVLLFSLILFMTSVFAQTEHRDSVQLDTSSTQLFKILKTDGGELIGYILKKDAREVYFKTNKGREIIIPQHVIQEIEKLETNDFNKNDDFIGGDLFSTRYFISTNGLALEKGESYVLWNWWGPDIQFGLDHGIGVGVITTWLGAPVIGTIKKSWTINEGTHVALGSLIGTGSWGQIDLYGGLPYASVTLGKQNSNLSLSAGYGVASYEEVLYEEVNYYYQEYTKRKSEGAAMLSVAGMNKFSNKVSFVFESFFMITNDNFGGLITPGFRFQQEKGKAFQIGFAGIFADGDFAPIPMIQWFRSF